MDPALIFWAAARVRRFVFGFVYREHNRYLLNFSFLIITVGSEIHDMDVNEAFARARATLQ
jgi:hypothetical protein